jgi:hypothetical protein
MAYYGSNLITGVVSATALTRAPTIQRPVTSTSEAGGTVWQRARISFATTITLVGHTTTGDVIEMGLLPPNSKLVDFVLYNDEIDSHGTPTLTCKAGIMTGTPGDITRAAATVGEELLTAASTTFRDAAVSRHGLSAAQALALQSHSISASERSIGVALTAAVATSPATVRVLILDYAYVMGAWGV